MTRQELFENIKKKKSFFCIGLDTDLKKIPRHLHSSSDPIFEFNKQIIDATHDLCVAYKPNVAFYESIGSVGWESLEKTADYLKKFKGIFTIADAKRGDIGNTSSMYAQAFFGSMDFDAITVAPYMGEDSVTPFLQYEGKWVILLALTSNKGANDFQIKSKVKSQKSKELYEKVLEVSQQWGNADNMMYVVGATRAEMFADVRKIVPEHFLLVPGIGAQGGSLQEVAKYGMNKQCGLLVNSSRNIIYASDKEDFAVKAREEAMKMQKEMALLIEDAFNINKGHNNNIPFQSILFKTYYQKINGFEIEIDFELRKVFIFNSNRQIISTIYFSKSIQHTFTQEELLRTEHKKGDKVYYMYENGVDGKNWLWEAVFVESISL